MLLVMKKNVLYTCLLATLLLGSCNDWSNVIPKSTFDAPFPKKNKDLTEILGNKLYIKRGKDTTIFNIVNNGKLNLITDKNGDTIFCGTVSKFRGLYYFSQQLSDTAYLIYAVKIKDDFLYGLNAPWYEGILIDHRVEKGEYKKLVKSISKDGKIIRLHPDKIEMRKLYAMIMDSLPPDTLLAVPHKIIVPVKVDTATITQQIDPEDFEMFSKVYPNPATSELNVELQQKANVKFMLSDITGKALTNGELHDSINKVDVSSLHNGIYILTLVKADGKGEESVKIIKQ
jgi:hypothetical protein